MKRENIVALLLATVVVTAPALVWADDSVDCGTSCPSGKVMVSYADGNNATCYCQDAAAMNETVADPDVDPAAESID